MIYEVFLRPILTHGELTWSTASVSQIQRLNVLQNRVLGMIVAAPWFMSNAQIHCDLEFLARGEYAIAIERATFHRYPGRITHDPALGGARLLTGLLPGF